MHIQSLGEKIKQERTKRKISLRELARKLGISAAYLVDIEKNRRLPSEKILQKVADLLEVPTSVFDEFSPEVPKPVKDWIQKNPLVARVLSFLKRTPSPEKTIAGLEKSLDFPKTSKILVAIYESELQTIGAESCSWEVETGGDLFGIWGDIPIIYFATRSGPNAIRDQSHFRLDVNYLIKLSSELHRDWELRYFGDWHSHHRLGLEKPSKGDRERIERIAYKNNFHEMVEFIVTFSHSYSVDKKIHIHPYAYTYFPAEDNVQVSLIVLKGVSPIREILLNASLLSEQQLGSFSSFPLDRIIIPKEPLPRVPGDEGFPTEQISEKLLIRALLELKNMVSEEIELHKAQFGYIMVMPVDKQLNVALAIDQKWPHKILQADWMDRSCGKSEELPLDTSSASLANINNVRNIFLKAKELKNK